MIEAKRLTEKVGEELRLTVKLDGYEDGVEKDEDDDEPVEQLRLDDVSNFEPSHSQHRLDCVGQPKQKPTTSQSQNEPPLTKTVHIM